MAAWRACGQRYTSSSSRPRSKRRSGRSSVPARPSGSRTTDIQMCGARDPHHGVVAGIGFDMQRRGWTLSPQASYTRWASDVDPRLSKNQIQLTIGLSFSPPPHFGDYRSRKGACRSRVLSCNRLVGNMLETRRDPLRAGKGYSGDGWEVMKGRKWCRAAGASLVKRESGRCSLTAMSSPVSRRWRRHSSTSAGDSYLPRSRPQMP